MFENTPAIRSLGCVICVLLLLNAKTLCQDESSEVRRITLDEAKAKAAGAATSNIAQLSISAAKYHRQAAEADYFPKLNAEFLNLHYNKFMGETIQLFRRQGAVPLLGKDETAVALTFAQPVTQLLQVRQAVTIARADEQIAIAKVAQLAAQASENVERVYFALLIAQRLQSVAEKKLEALESASVAPRTAAVPAENLMERQAALLEARKELIARDTEVAELTQSLNTLLGFTSNTKLVLEVPEPAIETASLPQATQRALANSLEVVEAEQTLIKARAASQLSRLDYVPAVAIMGGYVNQPQLAVPVLPHDFSFIGFTASFDIFDFGKREKTLSERNAQVGMAEANVAMVKSKVAASVQKSFFDLERSQKLRDLTRRLAVSYQDAALVDTSGRAAAEAEMFQAELEYRNAYAQLKRLIDGR
jgi:outer membrane protein